MNRSQSLLARIAACTIALLVSARALADVTLSVVDATPTAFHDGTLPGIGETIFSADVHVEVTAGDAWLSGGIGMLLGTRKPEVYLYYAHDPNTGVVLLTAPGFDNDAQMFGTFMSEPRGQTQPARFGAPGSVGLCCDYWGGSPVPEAEPDWLDVNYVESPLTFTLGSGFTQRVTIDITESAYADRRIYAAVDGPEDSAHILLVGFESAAGTVETRPDWETRRWGFFAVPEPETGVLLGCVIGLACVVHRRRSHRGVAVFLLAAGTWCGGRVAFGQSGLVGPQMRIDASGPLGANETHVSSNHVNPLEAIAAWHEYCDLFGESRVAFAITLDGGRTWSRQLLDLPDGCTNSNDPFTFFDNLTGRMWVGAAASGCPGRRIVLALKAPGVASVGATVEVHSLGASADKAFGAAGPDPNDPLGTDPNSVYLYIPDHESFQRAIGAGDAEDDWSDPRDPNHCPTKIANPFDDMLDRHQTGGTGYLPRVGADGTVYIAYWQQSLHDQRILVDEAPPNGGSVFDEPNTAPHPTDPTHSDNFAFKIAPQLTPIGRSAAHGVAPGVFIISAFPSFAIGPLANENDLGSYTLYCVWHDVDPNTNEPNEENEFDLDVYLTKSTDHGRTWTTPAPLLDEGGTIRADQIFPALEVDPDGKLHLLYFDTRHTAQSDGDPVAFLDAYYAFSDDDGETWSEERLTQVPFRTDQTGRFSGAEANQFMGDYLGIAVGGANRVYVVYPSNQAGDGNIYVHTIDHNPPAVTPGCYKIDVGSGRSYALALNAQAPGSGTDFAWDPNAATLTLLAPGDWKLVSRDNPSDPNSCAEPNMAERGDISHRITIDPDIAGYTSLHLVARDILALTGGGDTLSFDTGEPNDPVGLRLNVRDIYGGVAGNHLRFDDAIGVLGDQGVNTAGTVAAGVVIDVERIGIGTRLELASLAGDLVCRAAEARGANPSGGGIEAGLAVLGDLTGAISIADDFPGRIEIGGDVEQGQIDIAGDMRGAIDIAGYCDGDITILGDMLGAARIHIGGQLKLGRTIAIDNLNLASEANQGALIEVCKHLVGTITAAAVRGRIEIGKSIGTDGTLAVGRVTPAGSVLVGAHLRGLMDVDDGSPGSGLADLAGVLEVRQDVREGGRLYVKDCLRSQARIFGSLLDNGGAPNPAEIAIGAIEAGGAITIDYDGNHDATGCEQAWGSDATIVVGTEVYDGSDYASDPSMRIELAELHVYDVSDLPGDCDNNWTLDPNDLVAFDAYAVSGTYETDYPGLGGPDDGSGNPFGSFKFHFDVNCDGVIGDPNDLTRLTALTGQNPPADCRNALPGCAAAADDCPLPPQAPIPPAPL